MSNNALHFPSDRGVEAMVKIGSALCVIMVLLFSSENSAAQQSGQAPDPRYASPERYAPERCRSGPHTLDNLCGSGTSQGYFGSGLPPSPAWTKIPSIA